MRKISMVIITLLSVFFLSSCEKEAKVLKIFKMIPANKIKEISSNIHTNYGDSDGLPPIKPILIILLIVGMLYLAVCYF